MMYFLIACKETPLRCLQAMTAAMTISANVGCTGSTFLAAGFFAGAFATTFAGEDISFTS